MMASYGALKILLIAILIIGSVDCNKKKCKKKKNCPPPPPDEPCVPETAENPCTYNGQFILAVDHAVDEHDDKCFVEFCWCEDGVIKPTRVYKDCCCRPTRKPDGAEEVLESFLNNMGQMACSLGMFGQSGGGMPDFGGGGDPGMGNFQSILEMLGTGGGGMGMFPGNPGTGEGSFPDIGSAFECVKQIEDLAAQDPNFDENAALLQCFNSLGTQGIQGIFEGPGDEGNCLAIFLECLGVEVFDLDSFDELLGDIPDNFMQCLLVALSTDGCGMSMGSGGDPNMGGLASIMGMVGGGNGPNPGGMGGIFGNGGIGNIESIIECLQMIGDDSDVDDIEALLGCFGIFGTNGIGGLLGSLTDQDDSVSCLQSIFDCMGIEEAESIDDPSQGLHPMFIPCLISSLQNGMCGLPEIDGAIAGTFFNGGENPELPGCIKCLVELLQSGMTDADPGFTAAVQACFDDSSQDVEGEGSICDSILECLDIEDEGATATPETVGQCLQSYAQSLPVAMPGSMFGVGEG